MRHLARAVPLAALSIGSLVLAGCADPDAAATADGDIFTVVTDIYPTTFAAEQVAGDDVRVIQLTPAGVEPHEYELTPQQVKQIADADLVAYLPGMIPAVEKAVQEEAADKHVDVSEGVTLLEGQGDEHSEEEGGDPHVWLDPRNMATMGANVATALTGKGVAVNADALKSSMDELYSEMSTTLGNCAIESLVTSHEAFGYLANAFGFEQVGISGLSPESQPSPAKLAEVATLVKQEGVTTIYFEELLPADAAKTIASETGATTALLDPIEGNTDDKGYPTIMRTNTATLQTGQSCS